MSSQKAPLPIVPGRSIADLHLGASIHEILSILKQDKDSYPIIDLHYSSVDPLTSPSVVSLPRNGLRLQFDGSDQRLRLIEVMDFQRLRLSYKGSELARASENSDVGSAPSFKRIYQIFGASYPGEYLRPGKRSSLGTYVLSWAGIAFTFPLQHSAWSAEKDHVSLLGSSAASPAAHMALFEGSSWPEVRRDLFTRAMTGPRSSALMSKAKDILPTEVELAKLNETGRIELDRGHTAAPFTVILNQTTPQDLVTELGAPNATHKRDNSSASPDESSKRRTSSSRGLTNGRPQIGSPPSSYSSTGTDTFDTDFDSGEADDDPNERTAREVFWCYFNHGMDILIGPPTTTSSSRPQEHTSATSDAAATPLSGSTHLVVLKVVLHGNVPGSYAFNRHRRLRWTLSLPSVPFADDLTSETNFDELKPALLRQFEGMWPASTMGRGKVVNRTWGGSPSDSSFFLPDAGEDLVEGGGSEQWLGNTRLYVFPGLVFEVLENGAVGALTVY